MHLTKRGSNANVFKSFTIFHPHKFICVWVEKFIFCFAFFFTNSAKSPQSQSTSVGYYCSYFGSVGGASAYQAVDSEFEFARLFLTRWKISRFSAGVLFTRSVFLVVAFDHQYDIYMDMGPLCSQLLTQIHKPGDGVCWETEVRMIESHTGSVFYCVLM